MNIVHETNASNASNHLTTNTLPNSTVSPIARGKGLYFWDENGKKYMDFSSQTLNLLLGQCYEPIVKEVINQARNLTCVSSRFGSQSYFETVKLLIELAPEGFTRVNIKMCDGSDANETGVKVAKKYTGKSGIISFYRAHTGQTTQTLQLRGYGRNPKTLKGSKENVHFVNPPECKTDGDYMNTIREIQTILNNHDDIGCLLLDPIMANAGVLVNSETPKFLREIQTICERNNILFVLDENQSFGWVPEIFASKHFNISPDVITLGKGLSGGHPLAGVLVKEKFCDVLDYNEADFTNGGHPLSCAASKATLKELLEKNFSIDIKQEYISNKLIELKKISKVKFKTRGVGLIHSIEIFDSNDQPSPEIASHIYNQLFDKGMFLRLYNQNIIIKPPIIVSLEEINILFDAIYPVFQQEGL
jgi:4-aminobutyrate aminotransferase-like enzyme